jgi:hypothetical protein
MLSIINLQPPRPSTTILGINVDLSVGIFTGQDAYARKFRRRKIRRLIRSRPADVSMLSRQESAASESRQPRARFPELHLGRVRVLAFKPYLLLS